MFPNGLAIGGRLVAAPRHSPAQWRYSLPSGVRAAGQHVDVGQALDGVESTPPPPHFKEM